MDEVDGRLVGGLVVLAAHLGLDDHLKSGALIELFPDWPDGRYPLYVYYASRSHVPAKVRKFIDFITETLAAKPDSPRTVPTRLRKAG